MSDSISGSVLKWSVVGVMVIVSALSWGQPLGPTKIADVPWDPKSIESLNKVIYGTDDRIDVFEETDMDRQALTNSVCALVSPSSLSDGGGGTFNLALSQLFLAGHGYSDRHPDDLPPVRVPRRPVE